MLGADRGPSGCSWTHATNLRVVRPSAPLCWTLLASALAGAELRALFLSGSEPGGSGALLVCVAATVRKYRLDPHLSTVRGVIRAAAGWTRCEYVSPYAHDG